MEVKSCSEPLMLSVCIIAALHVLQLSVAVTASCSQATGNVNLLPQRLQWAFFMLNGGASEEADAMRAG